MRTAVSHVAEDLYGDLNALFLIVEHGGRKNKQGWMCMLAILTL